jgi:hypothetical protein
MKFITTALKKEDGTFGTEVHLPVVKELENRVCIVLHCDDYFLFDRNSYTLIACPLKSIIEQGVALTRF